MMATGVLLVPVIGDPAGLLSSGFGGSVPPRAVYRGAPDTNPGWRPASAATPRYRDRTLALVLAWKGRVICEGCDRVAYKLAQVDGLPNLNGLTWSGGIHGGPGSRSGEYRLKLTNHTGQRIAYDGYHVPVSWGDARVIGLPRRERCPAVANDDVWTLATALTTRMPAGCVILVNDLGQEFKEFDHD